MHDISLKLAYSEVEKIGIDAKKTVGKADLQNIKMFNLFGWFCTFVGYTSGALFLNPISVYLVSLGNYIHWMKAHYVLHGAYDNIPSVPTQFNSKNFAKGIRRYIDWLDWIVPEHWRHEHNSLHHYNTSQREDPDNIERLFKDIRRANIPVIFKYFITFAIALTWKLSYYAPSTYLYYLKKKGKVSITFHNFYILFNPFCKLGLGFWYNCILPYGLFRSVLIPILFLPFGTNYVVNSFLVSIFAEALANLHSFLMIGPNHTASDLHKFIQPSKGKFGHFIHQVYCTANYSSKNTLHDYWHGYMNFHLEHHIWPDLTMLQYSRASKKLRKICMANSLPYIEDNVFKRAKYMLNVCVGKSSTKIYSSQGQVE